LSGPALSIAGIEAESVVDGPGYRTVIFAQGCPHRCPGCHNPHTHPFEGGQEISVDEILSNIQKNPLLSGVTFSGGEPFSQADAFAALAEKVKETGLSVMVYTGYTFEELAAGFDQNPGWRALLAAADILVDGRFILSEKSLLLKFRGSANQRILDPQRSLESVKAVEYEGL